MKDAITRRIRHIRAPFAVIALVISIPAHVAAADTTPSSGPRAVPLATVAVRSEIREVGAFQAVRLQGSIDLVLRQGARERVEVQADDGQPGRIETPVVERGGVPTLEIADRSGQSRSRTTSIVTLDVVALKSLEVEGSGDVSGDGLRTAALRISVKGSGDVVLRRLQASEVHVAIKGSGDVQLEGQSPALSLSIAGSGDVDASALKADEVSVSIAGSGDAKVDAQRRLSVSIAGSGDVSYTGAADLQSSISGGGSVRRR